MADVPMAGLSRTRNTCRSLATLFDEAEVDLHKGLHEIHQSVVATAVATSALSCGTEDHMKNEGKDLDTTVPFLELILTEVEGGCEFVSS